MTPEIEKFVYSYEWACRWCDASVVGLHREALLKAVRAEGFAAGMKAVKLSDEEISGVAISNSPNVHIYARAIEAAALKKNGVTE